MDNSYQPYLGWGLNDIEDIIEAFTKYEKGGWWVRKIVYKDAFHREIVFGPYTEENAKKDVREWNEVFKFKGLATAKAYSFTDLICHSKFDYDYLKEYLFEEYIWKPPYGSELFCLVYSEDIVMMLKKSKLNNKIKTYILEKEIDLLDSGDYEIFYKQKNILARLQAKTLKKLTQDYKDYPREMWNLYNYALNKENRGNPEIIPGYIKDFDIVPRTFNLNYFKKFKNYSRKDTISKIKTEAKLIGIEKYTLPFIYNREDVDIKNLTLSFKGEKTVFSLKDEENFIELEGNCLKYSLDLFKSKKILNFFIYLAKVLKYENIKTKDLLKEYCADYPLYINIIRFIANRESLLSELGFVEENIDKRKEVISKYQDKNVSDFLPMTEEDLFYQKNLKELANDYLDNNLKDKYYCQILNKISIEIYNKYKNCLFEYFLNLEEYNLTKN